MTHSPPNERVEKPPIPTDEQPARDSRSGEGAESALERLRELERRKEDRSPAPTVRRPDSLATV